MDQFNEYDRAARIGALERAITDTWRRIADHTDRHVRIDRLLREVAELEHRVSDLRVA